MQVTVRLSWRERLVIGLGVWTVVFVAVAFLPIHLGVWVLGAMAVIGGLVAMEHFVWGDAVRERKCAQAKAHRYIYTYTEPSREQCRQWGFETEG